MSTLKVDTIQDTNAVEMYLCKAWVNFDGTQAAADMIRASGNVSSITDNGTGDYTINFTTAMPDADYACFLGYGTSATSTHSSQLEVANGVAAPTASAVRLRAEYGGIFPNDISLVCVSVFR